MLYYKFYKQYMLIEPIREAPFEDHDREVVVVTRTRFRFRKSLLYQVIAFRRTYVAAAFASNLTADLATWLLTHNVYYVAAVGVGLEVLRRILKL